MNKTFRLALLSDTKQNSEQLVIDFTRYDITVEEPVSASTRNWSLMGEINQKQTRSQDKPIPLRNLGNDSKSVIRKLYPEFLNK